MKPIHTLVIVAIVILILSVISGIIILLVRNSKKMEKKLLKDYLKLHWSSFMIELAGKNIPCNFQSQLVTVIDAVVEDVYDKYGMNTMNVIKNPTSGDLGVLKDIITKEMAMCMDVQSVGNKIKQYASKLREGEKLELAQSVCIADKMLYRYGTEKDLIDEDILKSCAGYKSI